MVDCFNIGTRECLKRQQSSIIAFVLTILMYLALRVNGSQPVWYLLLILPAWVAVLGLLQARTKT